MSSITNRIEPHKSPLMLAPQRVVMRMRCEVLCFERVGQSCSTPRYCPIAECCESRYAWSQGSPSSCLNRRRRCCEIYEKLVTDKELSNLRKVETIGCDRVASTDLEVFLGDGENVVEASDPSQYLSEGSMGEMFTRGRYSRWRPLEGRSIERASLL